MATSRGYAFGVDNAAVLQIGALLVSVVFGVLWNASLGSGAAFGVGAALSLVVMMLLFVVVGR